MTRAGRFGTRAQKRLAAWSMACALVIASLTATSAAASGAEVPATPVGSVSQTIVKTADLSKFQPGNIISDAAFFNSGTMTQVQIQSFLEAKVPKCQSGYTCLRDWYDTSRTTTADAMCKAYSGGIRERASTIIYKVAQACGINPQVLIVMLQKEQGLVNHVWPSEWRYTIAMGQGCPDTAACDTRYYGFFNQVYGAAWQMKRYANPPGTSAYFTWYAPGKTWNVRWHPNSACGSAPVYIQNQATANLYYYTPYQPNAAAIRAGYGEGDGCSSYGNRNFYQYFTDWFGGTQAPTDACAQPSSARTAVKTYLVTAPTLSARLAPDIACAKDVVPLPQGTVLQAIAVVDGWLRVNTEAGSRWVAREYVRYATADETPCALPGAVSAAKNAYTVTAPATTLRAIPHSDCEIGIAGEIARDTVVQAVAVSPDKAWLKVRAGTVDRWVARTDLRRATTEETACALPGGVVTAQYIYQVRSTGSTGRAIPSSACAIGVASVSGGVVVQAVEASASKDWLKVSTGRGELWVPRADLTRYTADPCSAAASIRAAKRTYVVLSEGAAARSAPTTSCAGDVQQIAAGTVVSPHAVTVGGEWVLVALPGGERWVARAALRYATAEESCLQPADTSPAKLSYVVSLGGTVARVAPHTDCATGSVAIPSGTVAIAVAVTAAKDWLRLRLPSGDLWVLRSAVTRAP
jgi:hypothetical protein